MKRSCLSPQSGTVVHLLGLLIATLLRLLGATWRLETRGLEPLSKLLADDRRVLLVFWHGGYLPLFPLLRGHKAAILTSDSLRGRIIMDDLSSVRLSGHDPARQ
ncbi:hypothetical protein [Ectothiorhodospira shaposhnikovii]|uniref:hypothetical protein n=1 Tax=Ectothiorhodospira shaposhnikovii TaxID=1054 RepID=UPI0039A131C8